MINRSIFINSSVVIKDGLHLLLSYDVQHCPTSVFFSKSLDKISEPSVSILGVCAGQIFQARKNKNFDLGPVQTEREIEISARPETK